MDGPFRNLDPLTPQPIVPRLPPIRTMEEVLEDVESKNYASAFHRHLIEWINAFDAELDEEHEVGARIVNFGQAITIHLHGIGYADPSLITFAGRMADTGDPVELIQHVSQISILLVKLKRENPEEPKKRIGFQ